MLLLIALSCFASIALGMLALARRAPDPVRVRAQALAGDAFGGIQASDQSFAGRVLQPLGRPLMQLLPHRWLQRVETQLVAAGEPLDAGLFLVLWAIAAVGGVLVGLTLGLWGTLAFGFVGIYGPHMWLRRAADNRRLKIRRSLPNAIDLLVTCVEAGLGLDAALIRVSEATDGPLGDEVARTLREISVGRSRREALLELGTRPGVPDLDGVMRPIVQAEASGVSIGTALRVQADSLRVRRRQRAQETAQKIPAKMVLVIAAFFIPLVMLIAITPAVFTLMDFFRQGGLT
jgi:tight adherence protein C